jgi:hypothetical protein
VEELESKFAISAAAVTAASAGRLERDLPSGESVFQAWPSSRAFGAARSVTPRLSSERVC